MTATTTPRPERPPVTAGAAPVLASDDAVLQALAGFAEFPDWLAAGMDGDRIRSALAAAVPGLEVLGCLPERLRAKDDRWACRYCLTVAGADGVQRELVLVGELVPPGPRRDGWPVPGPGPAPAEEGWEVWLPDLGIALRATSTDDALPSLPQLTDPDQARVLVEETLRAAGRPGLTVQGCEPDVVRYKPGSRCTIVYRLTYPPGADPAWPPLVVGKTHQGDKGAVAWDAMRALWRTPLATGDVVTLAEPLAFDPVRRILVQGPVPGSTTLKDLVRTALVDGSGSALEDVRVALQKTAAGLAALHGSGVRYGGTDTWDDEIAEVQAVIERLTLSVPSLRAAAAPLLTALREQADRTPADAGVPSHNTFRPAQVMLHDGHVGFIDFDGSCTAEPALDLGRFTAKLRDIGISTPAPGGAPLTSETLEARLTLVDELAEHFVRSYEAHAPVTRARIVLWETTDLLTQMLHAWTKVLVRRLGPRLALLEHQLRRSGA